MRSIEGSNHRRIDRNSSGQGHGDSLAFDHRDISKQLAAPSTSKSNSWIGEQIDSWTMNFCWEKDGDRFADGMSGTEADGATEMAEQVIMETLQNILLRLRPPPSPMV